MSTHKSKWILGLAAGLTIATAAIAGFADTNNGGNGNGGRPPPAPPPAGNDGEVYPNACNASTKVNQVRCSSTINYSETVAAPSPWLSSPATKPAQFANASIAPNTGVLSCVYSSDGTDRMSISQPSAKACVVSKKFSGFNCCK